MAENIRIRARLVDPQETGLTEVRVLMLHPMETGLRKNEAGDFVPAHYITQVNVLHGDRTVLQARMTLAVSKDPLLSFRFRGGRAGDSVSVQWTDNRGRQLRHEARIA